MIQNNYLDIAENDFDKCKSIMYDTISKLKSLSI